MTTALIVYDQSEEISFYVTEDPDLIKAAKELCGKYCNSVDTTEEEDGEIVALVNALAEDECEIEIPHTGDVINEVYHIGFIG